MLMMTIQMTLKVGICNMSLKSRKQSIYNLVPQIWVLRTSKSGHANLFQVRSDTSKHTYLMTIATFKPVECQYGLKVTCLDKNEHMTKCDGNCKVICKHSLAAVIKRLAWQGLKVSLCATLKDAKRLLNLFARKSGKLVKLVGESGYCYGVVSNG